MLEGFLEKAQILTCGTNANAVKTQIWTALIAMLALRYLQLMSTFGWSLSNLAALLRHQLLSYTLLSG